MADRRRHLHAVPDGLPANVTPLPGVPARSVAEQIADGIRRHQGANASLSQYGAAAAADRLRRANDTAGSLQAACGVALRLLANEARRAGRWRRWRLKRAERQLRWAMLHSRDRHR